MRVPEQLPVFTYWEGPMHPFTEICIQSIGRVFGERHHHLTPASIRAWIEIDDPMIDCQHLIFRSDYIRTKLLKRHGGWWFDSDILLFRNPDEQVADCGPMIWNLIYFYEGRWQPLINCGILFSPPETKWINAIAADFDAIDIRNLKMDRENEDLGQQIYERWSEDPEFVRVGHEHAFNSTTNVDANFRPFFDGTISLESARYGLHIGASLARWAKESGDKNAKALLEADSVDEVVRLFPRSVVAQYTLKCH